MDHGQGRLSLLWLPSVFCLTIQYIKCAKYGWHIGYIVTFSDIYHRYVSECALLQGRLHHSHPLLTATRPSQRLAA